MDGYHNDIRTSLRSADTGNRPSGTMLGKMLRVYIGLLGGAVYHYYSMRHTSRKHSGQVGKLDRIVQYDEYDLFVMFN